MVFNKCTICGSSDQNRDIAEYLVFDKSAAGRTFVKKDVLLQAALGRIHFDILAAFVEKKYTEICGCYQCVGIMVWEKQ